MMKKIFIILSLIFLIFLIFFFALFFLIKSYLTPQRVRDFAEKTLKSALQKEIKIKEIEPRISLFNPGILSKKIDVYEDKEKKFISIKELDFSLKLLPLIFKRTLEIEKIYIKEPEVFIYIEEKEREKEKIFKEKEKEKIEIPIFFILQKLEIERGKIDIIPERGEKISVYPFNLRLSSKHIEKDLIEFKGKGDVGYKKLKELSPLKFDFNFNFDIKRDIAEIKEYSLNTRDMEFSGDGEIKGLIEGKIEYKINLKSENISLSLLKDFAEIKDFDLKGKVDISLNLKGGYGDRVPYITGDIVGKEVLVETRERKVNFSELKIKFKGHKGNIEAGFLSGKQMGNLDLEFSLLPPNEFEGKGALKGNLIEFTEKDKNYSLNFNVRGSFTDILYIKGKFIAGRNDFNFDLKGERKRKILYVEGSLNSDYFNLNDILPEEKGEGEKKKGKPPELILPQGISIFMEGFIRDFIFKEDNLKDIKFNFELDEKGIRIKNLKGKIFGGNISGDIEIGKGSIIVKSNLKGDNIEFSELLKKHEFIPSLIKGKLSIQTDTRFNLQDILGTLYSENLVFVFNGEIKKDPVLEKIADILKIEEIKSLEFNKIDLKLKIEKGWINFSNFSIDCDGYLIFSEGRASLKGDLDIGLLFKFKGKKAEILRKYSSFAKYFINKEGDFELYFRLNGSYKNPRVLLDIGKFEEKLKGEIKKETKEKIEEGIKKGLEELKKKFRF